MRISVIIPTYNRASLIGETLDAVLAQTRPADQIIVVDDGSTDETPALIPARYPGVTYIRIANSGDMVGRNTGLRAATGDLVAFCDSDDLWCPDHLATMAGLWQAAPGLRFAFANFRLVLDGVWQPGDKFADAPPGFWAGLRALNDTCSAFDMPIPERLLAFQPIFPSALVADRAFMISTGGWDEAVSRLIGCDFATALRLVEHAPCGVVRRVTVGIRKHRGNISADVQKMDLGDSLVLEHVLATRPSMARHADAIRASILARRRNAFETAFARGDLAGAQQIDRLLPAGLGGKIRIKRAVLRLPPQLGQWVTGVLTGARSR